MKENFEENMLEKIKKKHFKQKMHMHLFFFSGINYIHKLQKNPSAIINYFHDNKKEKKKKEANLSNKTQLIQSS